MYCPNCPAKYPITMKESTYVYSWKDGKPIAYMVEYYCPECGIILRTSQKLTLVNRKSGLIDDKVKRRTVSRF